MQPNQKQSALSGRQFASSNSRHDPVSLHKGAISSIVEEVREALEKVVEEKRYGRVVLDVNISNTGIDTYNLMSGSFKRVG